MTTTRSVPTTQDEEPFGPSRHRMRRALARIVVAVVVITIALLAAGWYFAGKIRSGAFEVHQPEQEMTLRVVAASPHSVTLQESGDSQAALRHSDTYGLAWNTGYGQVTGSPHTDGTAVTRDFVLIEGSLPRPGQPARLDRDAFPPDHAHLATTGLRLNQVTYHSPVGRFHAWLSPGHGHTWVILVHGQRATPSEVLRPMTITTQAGLPSMAITYRNDEHEPQDSSHVYGFGQSEWPDLESAVRYANANGAHRVVLVGYSMGGAIVAAFMQHSELSNLVSAVVLDSPMLNLSDTIDHQAAARSLPTPLTWTAKQLAAMRYHVHWDQLDYLSDTSWVHTPTLIFHGTDDSTAPIKDSQTLARAHPDLVHLIQTEHAEHVASWNADPTAYQHAMIDFLSTHT
jgi:uncharacterized protein